MRLSLAIAILLALLTVGTDHADARKGTRVAKGHVYGYQAAPKAKVAAPSRSDDGADCVRAESNDPSHQYGDFPCWARNALSPRGRMP